MAADLARIARYRPDNDTDIQITIAHPDTGCHVMLSGFHCCQEIPIHLVVKGKFVKNYWYLRAIAAEQLENAPRSPNWLKVKTLTICRFAMDWYMEHYDYTLASLEADIFYQTALVEAYEQLLEKQRGKVIQTQEKLAAYQRPFSQDAATT